MNLHVNSDVIRIIAKFYSKNNNPLQRKLSLDPNLTTYKVLINLLYKCFPILPKFSIEYHNSSQLVSITDDTDLSRAFQLHSQEELCLYILSNFETDEELQMTRQLIQASDNNSSLNYLMANFSKKFRNLPSVIGSSVSETWNSLHGVSFKDMKSYQNERGKFTSLDEFKRVVFNYGVEGASRKEIWPILLNVFPEDMDSNEREIFMDSKRNAYQKLWERWKRLYSNNMLDYHQISILAMIAVDVVRTNKNVDFYGSNQRNVELLFEILSTYCLYHPSVGYFQGMSDIASPLLYVLEDPGSTYVCFCSLMNRLHRNFSDPDQVTLINKMQHLHDLIVYTDVRMARFLRHHGLANMHFTQRWLLLELKREFTFSQMLNLFEVQWASIPDTFVQSSQKGTERQFLSLVEKDSNLLHSLDCQRERHKEIRTIVKDVALINSLLEEKYRLAKNRLSSSDFMKKNKFQTHVCNMNETVREIRKSRSTYNFESSNFEELVGDLENVNNASKPKQSTKNVSFFIEDVSDDVFIEKVCNQDCSIISEDMKNRRKSEIYDSDPVKMKDWIVQLPPPDQFGSGNPMLLFLCLSLLQEYRQEIFDNVDEYSDLISLYQEYSGKHNLNRILSRARKSYLSYLDDQKEKTAISLEKPTTGNQIDV